MESEVCSDKKGQISVIVQNGPFTLTDFKKERYCCTFDASKTITLLQEPEETATLNFSLKSTRTYRSYDPDYYNLEYSFTLNFKNNLHEVSSNYSYEIDFHICDHENESSSHTLLFSRRQIRKTNKFLVLEKFDNCTSIPLPEFINKFFKNSDKQHLCCSIRRWNTKTAEKNHGHINQEEHIGIMLLESGHYSDVSLIAGQRSFQVHKFILSSASDIFKAMFSYDMVENKENTVLIKDFDPEVVEGLLSFIYTGKTSLLSKMPIELFKIAHKYEIQSLKDKCIESFLFTLHNSNVVDTLYTASMYELVDLKTRLLKFIEIHEEEMVKEKSFQDFLCSDLKIDTIAYTLKLCDKYKELLKDVKYETFKFIKENSKTIVGNAEFLKMFESHPVLMKDLFVFIHKVD